MKRIAHFFYFILLVIFAYVSFYSLMPKRISNLNTAVHEFSTERALIHLKEMSKEPHYVGTAAHEEVKAYLVRELQKMGLETEIQEDFELSNWGGFSELVKPQNILARIKGTGSGEAVMVLSHYDSAPHSGSYGASDAGSGVVTILESIRAFLASGQKHTNDIIICITDAEELGLHGASLFVNNHQWAKDVKVALNFEARGSGGPSNMIVETNGGNSNLIKGFKEAGISYPVGTSLMYSIYKMLPNDTDSTILREDGDIDGFFFAFIDDHFDYHTVNDTYENLDRNSLEHQGSYLLPLLKYYANADLNSVKSEQDDVYFDIAVFKFISYPFSWIFPMLILAILLFIGLIYYGVKKERFSGVGITKGYGAFLLSLLASGGLFYLLWELIKLLNPSYQDILPVFIYNGHWYIIAFVLLGFSLILGIYHRLTKAQDTPSTFIAPLTFWLLINTLLAIYLKGAAFFIIPIFFGLLCLFLMVRQQFPNKLLLTLLCAPAVFMCAPLVQFFPVGLGLDMLYTSTIFLTLLFGLLLPVLGYFRNKKILAIVSLFISFVFFGIASSKSSPSLDRKAPNSLIYYHNADTDNAYWATYNENLDEWTKGYLGQAPEVATKFIGNAAGSKYNTSYSYANKTQVIDLPKSLITVVQDTLINGLSYHTLNIKPQRLVHQIRMYTDQETPLRYIEWNGKKVTPDSTNGLYKKRRSKGILSYYRSSEDDLIFRYAVPEGNQPSFVLKEYSYDLLENPKFTVASRPDHTMPMPFVSNDAAIVEQTINTKEYFKPPISDTLNLISFE